MGARVWFLKVAFKEPRTRFDNRGMFDLQLALRRVIETGGSDLHLKVPSPPLVRALGKLEPIEGAEPLAPEDTERILHELLNGKHDKLEEFAAENDVPGLKEPVRYDEATQTLLLGVPTVFTKENVDDFDF